ncbi:MAG TPA: glucosyl transferase, partial [Ignavibacteriaceae bacterium]
MDIHKIFPVFILFIFIFFTECDTTEPPDKGTLTLTFEDASCTETWLTLTTENLQLPATIELKQDDQTRSIINLVKADTLIYIDSLFPNKTYKFHTTIQSYSHTSNELSVATLDTTSHNFTFQTWTFGEHSSSTLYDVA